MMLDLGWHGMQSKVWIGVFALAGCTLFAVAQADVAPSSDASSDAAQTAAANAVVTSDGVDDSALEASIGGLEEISADAPEQAIAEIPAGETINDNYTPTERISEDRSVSFPVDI